MFNSLEKLLRKKMKKKDYLSQQVTITQVFDIYKQALQKKFPKDNYTHPVSLKNKTLTIKTQSAVQANELRFIEPAVLAEINEKEMMVERVVYRF